MLRKTDKALVTVNYNGDATMKRLLMICAAAIATMANADNIAWGNKNGQFVWSSVGNWLSADNTSVLMNRLPTEADDVFLWAGGLTTSPLVVQSGEVALTRAFTCSYVKGASTGNTRDILFEIANDGVMTNTGAVVIGDIASGVASGRAVSGSVTVRSGGSWTAESNVTVGRGMTPSSGNAKTSRILVEQDGEMFQEAGEFVVGGLKDYGGTVTNNGTLAAYDLFVGGKGNGVFENNGDLRVANKFRVARESGSSGVFVHKGGTITHTAASTQPIRIGYSSDGLFQVDAPLAFSSEMVVVGNENGGKGSLVVNDTLSGVRLLKLGESAGSVGNLSVAGGAVIVNATTAATTSSSGHAIYVGMVDESGEQTQTAIGSIRGYGKIGRTETTDDSKHARIKNYGQIVADGGDLDLGLFRLVGLSTVDANKCGTNGWYAVNGGRLIYPRRLPVSSANHIAIGDYGTNTGADGNLDISLVNSLQVRLYKDGSPRSDYQYNYAMLYAADRADIPGTIPCSADKGDKVLGVWRLGHFSDLGDVGATPQKPDSRFDTASVRIRFDDAGVNWEKEHVVLYRWDGTKWRRVGEATEGTHVGTATPQPRYESDDNDNWNIGWYAAVSKHINGFMIIFK